MNVQSFKEEFDYRHEIDDDALNILKERWPNIKFHEIPHAWVIVIDEMLSMLRYNNPVKEIRQDYGQFIVIHDDLNENQQAIVKQAESQLYLLDVDLHVRMENETSS